MKLHAITVHLAPDQHQLAKQRAAAEHITLAALVRQALDGHLNGRTPVDGGGLAAKVTEVEKGLDRVLVEVIRLGDRVAAIGR